MATAEQMQAMMELMQQQMKQMQLLQDENTELRRKQPSEAKIKRPDRPSIEANLSDSDWALFEDTWKRYKAMTGLRSDGELRMELRASCSSDVNKLLFEYVGPTQLDGATEEELLAHIKSVAVKGLHKEVHRMNFGKMRQADGESITHYVARLKSKASLCSFVISCACQENVSYAEEMISQQLVTGLRDQQHQSKILSEASTLTTLKAKVERLQILETTEEATTKLQVTTGSSAAQQSEAAAAKSKYKQEKSRPREDKSKKPPTTRCKYCGRSSHPSGKSMERKNCPAADKKCLSCGTEGHFRAVCLKAKQSNASAAADEVRNTDNDGYDTEEDSRMASTAFFFATRSLGEEQKAPRASKDAPRDTDFRLVRPKTPND